MLSDLLFLFCCMFLKYCYCFNQTRPFIFWFSITRKKSLNKKSKLHCFIALNLNLGKTSELRTACFKIRKQSMHPKVIPANGLKYLYITVEYA